MLDAFLTKKKKYFVRTLLYLPVKIIKKKTKINNLKTKEVYIFFEIILELL